MHKNLTKRRFLSPAQFLLFVIVPFFLNITPSSAEVLLQTEQVAPCQDENDEDCPKKEEEEEADP
ncbi:MAG: hypothetical protein Q7S13_00850, partial [Candidatus Omnitrophota bacterium]|nr:hypothetical protein [Candidatus Omnitrophota bacterium]